MEVDYSSSNLISWQEVKKSKLLFWWNFKEFFFFFLGGGRGLRGKGTRACSDACSDVSEIWMSSLKKSAENGDWWRFILVMTISFFEHVVIWSRQLQLEVLLHVFMKLSLLSLPHPPKKKNNTRVRELARRLCCPIGLYFVAFITWPFCLSIWR